MNELATNTKRAYEMKVWEVVYGLSSPLFIFYFYFMSDMAVPIMQLDLGEYLQIQ